MLYLWIVLQIVLESLPVSSSGHVALMQQYIKNFGDLATYQDKLWIVDYLLHGPMIIILLLFFFKTWWQMIFGKNMDFKSSLGKAEKIKAYVLAISASWRRIFDVMIFGLIADGITVLCWWLDVLPTISLTVGFCITAMLLYATKYCKERSQVFDASFVYAFLLGIGQSLSLLPGISRFGTTYAVGRFCGYSGRISFAVSFMIQFPLLIAAFCKGFVAVKKYQQLMMNFFDFNMLFVILMASIVSYILLIYVDYMIKRNKLWLFSWYMLIPIVLTLFV